MSELTQVFEKIEQRQKSVIAEYEVRGMAKRLAVALKELPVEKALVAFDSLDAAMKQAVKQELVLTDCTSDEALELTDHMLAGKPALLTDEVTDSVLALLAPLHSVQSEALLQKLALTDPVLAANVRYYWFTFDDVPRLDNEAVKLVLRELDQQTLITSLVKTSAECKMKFFENMDLKTAAVIDRKLKKMSYDEAQVTKARQTVTELILRLDQEGVISIVPESGDMVN